MPAFTGCLEKTADLGFGEEVFRSLVNRILISDIYCFHHQLICKRLGFVSVFLYFSAKML